ncbi:SEC10/PgrA surface exclusion domain-containing protein [Weissella cibaria]|uniref:SEC10/PgrA surface exclusion domain-containing protein n=1 Tax=Weissella cibaria TaxID=137591 RepID=UPI0011940430|nr:SEC10/PgrA surface exclusion domain-containing protein [Weissella cibaria]TVV34677.1 SEC10/PgrA surface exclusion domain-containing protein [Weissella cibaria]
MIQRDGTRKKLYKAGKLWVVATLFGVALSGVVVAQPASAATRRQTATKKAIATATSAAKIAKTVSVQSAAIKRDATLVASAGKQAIAASSAARSVAGNAYAISNNMYAVKAYSAGSAAATSGKTAQIVSQATSATTVATSASAVATKQVADISNRQKMLKSFVKKEGVYKSVATSAAKVANSAAATSALRKTQSYATAGNKAVSNANQQLSAAKSNKAMVSYVTSEVRDDGRSTNSAVSAIRNNLKAISSATSYLSASRANFSYTTRSAVPQENNGMVMGSLALNTMVDSYTNRDMATKYSGYNLLTRADVAKNLNSQYMSIYSEALSATSSATVRNPAELPTSLSVPAFGKTSAGNLGDQSDTKLLGYLRIKPTDGDRAVDISKGLTTAQNQELTNYAVQLINGYRKTVGLDTLKTSDFMLKGTLADKFVDYEPTQITTSYYQWQTLASGSRNSPEDWSSVFTMTGLKVSIYNGIYGMLFDDGGSAWGHRTTLLQPGIRTNELNASGATKQYRLNMALAIPKMHSGASTAFVMDLAYVAN